MNDAVVPDAPTSKQILAARIQAGLTQAQCAVLAGYGAQSRWAEIEAGRRHMDRWRWEYFLHRAGITRIPYRKLLQIAK